MLAARRCPSRLGALRSALGRACNLPKSLQPLVAVLVGGLAMTLIRPFLIIFACCALLPVPAKAATYNIDASLGGSTFHLPFPGGDRGYASPIYNLAPGDTVDFGTITLHNFYIFVGSGWGQGLSSVYQISFSPLAPAATVLPGLIDHPACGRFSNLPCGSLPPPTSHRLLVTLPDDATQVQIAWFGVVDYAPPTESGPTETPLPAAAFLFASALLGAVGATRIVKSRTLRRQRPSRRSSFRD
jgi:hypothetical protein